MTSVRQDQRPHQPPRWVQKVVRIAMAAILVYAAAQARAAHQEVRSLREHQAGQAITMRQPTYLSSWIADPGITVQVSTYADEGGQHPALTHVRQVQALLDAGLAPVAD